MLRPEAAGCKQGTRIKMPSVYLLIYTYMSTCKNEFRV